MQEVFEKIIQRLYAEKIKNRSRVYSVVQCEVISYSFGAAIDAVKEAAAEYNNGWISCSERLPEMVGRYLVTALWEDGNFKKYSVYDAVYGSDGTWHVQDYAPAPYKVLAWQPLPEPYQSKGE